MMCEAMKNREFKVHVESYAFCIFNLLDLF